ncbi:MAG: Gfo/Idh/MocA family oxidoreductase [Planctomycetes bacterium]|nr:Gfo/Idh/MocA family oxidoreductase [Planctomycetota bacterium]
MNQPLRICLLGAGYIADWHSKAIASRRLAKVTAVCDRDAFRAKAHAARLGAKAFTSLDELLANAGELDAVHVLLPPQLHAAATTKILEAGLHAFVEKPMAVSGAECAALQAVAEAQGKLLGVSHNFLFVPAYQKLAALIAAGGLGIIDSIRVTWVKELPQFSFGPHGHWMFAAPANVLLEVGPHNCAQALHAAQVAAQNNGESAQPVLRWASCDKGIDLPRSRSFRRWQATVDVGSIRVDLDWSLVPGVVQHRIDVRGSQGNASVDLDRNIFTIEQPSDRAPDFDNAAILRSQGWGLVKQSTRNLANYALAKARLSSRGNIFGASIGDAVACFHETLRSGKLDPRIDGKAGVAAVALCEEIGARATAGAAVGETPAIAAAPAPMAPQGTVDALVLGGGGFIGRALIRSLLQRGKSVRVLGRGAGNPGLGQQNAQVQAVAGDMRKPEDLDLAMAGASNVYHLARGEGRTWQDWYETDCLATQLVAAKCLEHKVRRLVYTSTIAALDLSDPSRTIDERTLAGDPDVVRELYSRTKAHNERHLLQQRGKGLDIVITRPGIVIGPGCTPYHSGVANFHSGRIVSYWGQGRNPLPFILVDDCADALARCIDAADVDGTMLNLVGGVRITAQEYVAELERVSGLRFVHKRVSAGRTYFGELGKWVVKVAVRHHERRIPRLREWRSRGHLSPFDTRKTESLLGWTPRSDREEFVTQGIAMPARQFITDAAGQQR